MAEKREAFQERWGVTALYEDYLEMIAKETPDLVAICTKGHPCVDGNPRYRGGCADDLFGKDDGVMLEADAVLKACRENGVYLNTGVLRRFDSRYRQAKQWIDQGEIGDLQVDVHYAESSLLHGHIYSADTLMYFWIDGLTKNIYR